MKRYITPALLILISLSTMVRNALSREIIYASVTSHRLEKFELSGAGLGGFDIVSPSHIDADQAGNVAVSGFVANWAALYSSSGTGLSLYIPTRLPEDEQNLINTGPVAFGPDGSLYLCVNTPLVSSQGRIERFNIDGTSLGVFSSYGGPFAIAAEFDKSGNLFVATLSSGFLAFDPNGLSIDTPLSTIHAEDFAVDGQGNFYVVPFNSSSVNVYDRFGNLLRAINAGMLVKSVALDEDDIAYVGGYDNSRPSRPVIKRFLADGTLLGDNIVVSAPTDRGYEVYDLAIANVVPEPSSIAIVMVGWVILSQFSRRRL